MHAYKNDTQVYHWLSNHVESYTIYFGSMSNNEKNTFSNQIIRSLVALRKFVSKMLKKVNTVGFQIPTQNLGKMSKLDYQIPNRTVQFVEKTGQIPLFFRQSRYLVKIDNWVLLSPTCIHKNTHK